MPEKPERAERQADDQRYTDPREQRQVAKDDSDRSGDDHRHIGDNPQRSMRDRLKVVRGQSATQFLRVRAMSVHSTHPLAW